MQYFKNYEKYMRETPDIYKNKTPNCPKFEKNMKYLVSVESGLNKSVCPYCYHQLLSMYTMLGRLANISQESCHCCCSKQLYMEQ